MISASGETDLLELICAEPDNHENRLVYADWLMERGNPRGEFIMLQFKRESHGLTEEELSRERELFSTYSGAWLGPLSVVIDPATVVFRKGFLSECAVKFADNDQRRALIGHPFWATVEKLHCNDTALLCHPGLRSLWSVRFRGLKVWRKLSERPVHERIRAIRLDVRSWSAEANDRVAQTRGFPGLQRLELCYPDQYIERGGFFDFLPQTYLDLLGTEMVRRLEWLGIQSRLMLPLEAWKAYDVPRPDLGRWARWAHLATDMPPGWTISFQPYHGWRFSMHHESPGWNLSIGWNNACANSDLRALRLAMAAAGPDDFTRIMVHVLGIYRPESHQVLLQHILDRFPSVLYPG